MGKKSDFPERDSELIRIRGAVPNLGEQNLFRTEIPIFAIKLCSNFPILPGVLGNFLLL